MAQTAAEQQQSDPWRLAYRRLVGWAVKRRRLSPADAEDLVQEGIKQFIASGGKADGDFKGLLDGIGSRMNGVLIDQRRKKALTHVQPTSDGTLPELAGDHGENRVISEDCARKNVGALLERIEADKMLYDMVLHMADGIDTPSDLALALGVERDDVYNARRRLNGHATAVKASMEES